jgi:hypothetical protein
MLIRVINAQKNGLVCHKLAPLEEHDTDINLRICYSVVTCQIGQLIWN